MTVSVYGRKFTRLENNSKVDANKLYGKMYFDPFSEEI